MDLLHSPTVLAQSQNPKMSDKGYRQMTDVTVEQGPDAGPAPDFIALIELKGSAGAIEMNFSTLPDQIYQALLIAGAEAFLNKANGAAKSLAGITKLEGKELEDRKKEVLEAAEKTAQQLRDGIVPGAKKAKASGAVQTEAMRLAKAMVKDLIRNSGQKVGAYTAKELTVAAKEVLERNPSLLQLAEKNLAERATDAKGTKSLDLKGLFGAKAESEEVKAKPKAPPKRKEKGDKVPLSAKQAGMAAPRQKPTGATAH